jgi:hypothetical protein
MENMQGGKSENGVFQRTPRLCLNCVSDLISYFKSTIDLCYGILAGEVQPTYVSLSDNEVFGLYGKSDLRRLDSGYYTVIRVDSRLEIVNKI